MNLRHLCILILSLSPGILLAQTPPSNESGKFRLHKFEQPIGEETYTITADGNKLTLKTDFKFTDRGTEVPLTATLCTSGTYAPESFVIKGSTSRQSQIDTEVVVSSGDASPSAETATIHQGKETRTVPAPPKFFTISGYAPVAVQMAMMRYWRAHGQPAQLPTLPSGAINIRDRGSQAVSLNGRDVQLERYTVQGLIWGMETLWMDGANNLAASVSTDAEFDHFEAIRDEYEPALSTFVASAAHDQMAFLAEMSTSLPGRRTGTFAFIGGTVVDVTGKPAIPNATVVTSAGKIIAVGPKSQTRIPSDAQRIDVSGKYIVPGLWDIHAH